MVSIGLLDWSHSVCIEVKSGEYRVVGLEPPSMREVKSGEYVEVVGLEPLSMCDIKSGESIEVVGLEPLSMREIKVVSL